MNLTSALPLVISSNTNEITLRGSGAGLSILDGQNSTYHLWIKGPGWGGITLENITFLNGRNFDPSWASSIVSKLVQGTTTIKNCIFDSNQGNPAFTTGTDQLETGRLYFYSSHFLNNPNGGFASFNPRFMIYFKDVTMSGNDDIALKIFTALGARILNSTFDYNVVGIQLVECGSCLLENSSISENSSTGLEITTSSAGFPYDFKISNSTIYKNGTTAIDSKLKLGFSQAANKLILKNSIVAQSGSPSANCAFTDTHQIVATNSTIDDVSCQQSGNGNLNVDPRLEVLANIGGLTNTHNLLLGSPAIDSGSSALCTASDQRGLPRGATQCDIGVVEIQ